RCEKQLSEPSKPNWPTYRLWHCSSGFARVKTGSTGFAAHSLRNAASKYSLQWPTLACDYFKIAATEGNGTGESLQQFPLNRHDYVLADRGFCKATGIHFAVRNQAYIIVRLNQDSIRLQEESGSEFELVQKLQTIQKTGQIGQWRALIPLEGNSPVPVRLCVIRKSRAAIALAQKKLKRRASRRCTELKPETLFYAQYVMVLTTFPGQDFPAELILEWYRFRWQ